jgi:hypothetical protein
MSLALARRSTAIGGVVLAGAAALWWLGSTRLALEDGSDASLRAVGMLVALWLVRAMALALLSLRAGALRGWRAGTAQALGLIAPSWPLLVLAWSASTVTLAQVVLAEGLLLVASVVLPLIGQGIGRVLRRVDVAEATATTLGAGLAAALWYWRGPWSLPLGP